MTSSTARPIGIDFGTSNCSIGIWSNGKPRLLPLEGKSVQLPSVLFLARRRNAAGFSEEELEKRVRSTLRQQKKERADAKSKLRTLKQNLKRARSKLSDYKNQLVDRSSSRTRTHGPAGTSPPDLEQEIDRLNAEVGLLLAMRDTEKKRVSQHSKSDTELRAEQIKILRREASQRSLDAAARSGLKERLSRATQIFFGTRAIEQYLDGAEGSFLASPKSFIGANVPAPQLTNFTEIIARMLNYMRQAGEDRISTTGLTVIGRPVHFRGANGIDGDTQAEQILREAAREAGFAKVEFFYEPIAAALDYERILREDKTLLVVDVGGGTTDCSMVRVGPSRRNRDDRESDILGYDGIPTGGKDLDFDLAHAAASPTMGLGTYLQDGLPFPDHYFRDALLQSIPGRAEFYSEQTATRLVALANRSHMRTYVDRLLKVQREQLGDYILLQAEKAKIRLSRSKKTALKLGAIEPGLKVSINRNDYAKLANDTHSKLLGVIDNVVRQAGAAPDEVYVTGGMAQSPSLRAALVDYLGELELVEGDFFGNVVSGLTTWANKHSLGSEAA